MEYSLPKNILNIISTINDHGFNAHIVGGCVRDLLLKRLPSDWDITTNASPEIIKSLFGKTYETGIKHGTVTVILDDTPYEITTWRKESGYSDHRRPDHVYNAETLKEDLARRDFTMNAIAYHPKEGLIDPFGGYEDIIKRIIRCVGDPYKRFSEDALRMLRAVRFSAQLDFDIENNTKTAIDMLSNSISYISKERIQAEINKILDSSSPGKLKLLWETGLRKTIFPEINNFPDSWCDALKYLNGEEDQKEILLSLFFHEAFVGEALKYATDFLRAFKYDNKTYKLIDMHIRCLNNIGPLTRRNIAKAATEYGVGIALNTIKIIRAIESIKTNDEADFISCIPEMSPILLKVSGSDMKGLGLEGRNIKAMLDILSHCIYEKPELNDYYTLMSLANEVVNISFI